jgi:hypothetical protein
MGEYLIEYGIWPDGKSYAELGSASLQQGIAAPYAVSSALIMQ